MESYEEKRAEILLNPVTQAIYQQKIKKTIVTTQRTPTKSSIRKRLRTDLRREVGVTTAT